jgi:hypothetical protein
MSEAVNRLAAAAGAVLQRPTSTNELVAFTLQKDGHIVVETASGMLHRIATEADCQAAGIVAGACLTAENVLGVMKAMNPRRVSIRPGIRLIVETKSIRQAGRE